MTAMQEITVPAQRSSLASKATQSPMIHAIPTFRGAWYDFILDESSDKSQHPVIKPLSDIPTLYSDVAYGAGTSGSKTHRPEFAKVVLTGLPADCTISVYANGLTKPIGEKRLGKTSACVIFLRELTRVLPAGTTLKLHIAPIC